MSYAANLRSNTARSALINSSKRLAIVSAFVACSAPRGLGFIPAASSAQQGFRRRWHSAAPSTRQISSSSGGGGGGRSGSSRENAASRYYTSSSSGGGRRRRRKRERVSMAGGEGEVTGGLNGAGGGRLGPGKGTQVVLLRHGMSTFNKLNIFTGWCDVPLTEEGQQEALEAGKLLAAAGFRFDVAHASVLKRACTSLHRLLDGSGQPYVPIKTSWRLNERHYGALQGRNKATLEDAMGEVVVEWRRAYGVRPPPMTDTHPHWPLISLDSRYRGLKIPESESLRDTANRVMEYWESDIVPDIRAGKRVVVVAHANTLRSLVKRLDNVHEDAIRNVNIPTGEPFVYDFDADLKPIGEPDEHGFRGRFVGDMMAEKDAAIDEYKRREQACQDKWSENPEVVPEECLCTEDLLEGESADRAQLSAPPARFGEDQASLGLDRYSVGYDLPLPPMLGSAAGGDPTAKVNGRGSSSGDNVMRVVEEVGDLIVETLADLTSRDDEAELTAAAAADGGAVVDVGGGEDMVDRNETTSSMPPSSIST